MQPESLNRGGDAGACKPGRACRTPAPRHYDRVSRTIIGRRARCRGSHKARALKAHHTVSAGDVTLTQELDAAEFDEADAVDIVLKAGQLSLHDVYLLHGSEANTSRHPRRGMTMRFMPTSSVFDRELASAKARQMNIVDHSARPVFLLRGGDRSGRNTFAER